MNWFRKVNLFKEPLLHFLLIGAALFLLFGWRGSPMSVPGGQAGTQSVQIIVSRDAIEQMTSQYMSMVFLWRAHGRGNSLTTGRGRNYTPYKQNIPTDQAKKGDNNETKHKIS